MSGCILIGGGSGLIGSRLTEILLQKGYEVRHLGRKAKEGPVKTFQWDVHRHTMDERAFEGVTAVINLAGANVNGHRWTRSYKKEILTSRTGSTRLIVEFLNTRPHSVTNFLSGSAIGYYETGFMGDVVKAWEHEATLTNQKVKLAIIRTGIVLSERDGAYKEMARPIRFFVGAPLGSGKQIVSWIHLEDICGIFIHILENNLSGTFDATAPEPATNAELTKAIARKLHRPLLLPNIPGFVLRIVLGEMSDAVLNGRAVLPDKIESAGYQFKFPTLARALGI